MMIMGRITATINNVGLMMILDMQEGHFCWDFILEYEEWGAEAIVLSSAPTDFITAITHSEVTVKYAVYFSAAKCVRKELLQSSLLFTSCEGFVNVRYNNKLKWRIE